MKKKPRIIIINPNSDLAMTKAIQATAENFAGKRLEVLSLPTKGAPLFIETQEDEVEAAPGMIELVRKTGPQCDAFVIACHCDPNADVLKKMTAKPVIGIGEASMRLASMLGHRFSIIQTTKESVPLKEALVRKYQLEDFLASVRAPEDGLAKSPDEEKYLSAARAAMEEDRADVIVLGCAGLTGLDKRLQKELGIPVLDGVVCALIIASAFLSRRLFT
jgi:allantoin racemase